LRAPRVPGTLGRSYDAGDLHDLPVLERTLDTLPGVPSVRVVPGQEIAVHQDFVVQLELHIRVRFVELHCSVGDVAAARSADPHGVARRVHRRTVGRVVQSYGRRRRFGSYQPTEEIRYVVEVLLGGSGVLYAGQIVEYKRALEKSLWIYNNIIV